MATFGSYGNLGGELVSVIEHAPSFVVPNGGNITVNAYTVPAGRYALITRIWFDDNNPLYGLTNTFSASIGLPNNIDISSSISLEMSLLLNEGDSVVVNSAQPFSTGFNITLLLNFLIFEYRKP